MHFEELPVVVGQSHARVRVERQARDGPLASTAQGPPGSPCMEGARPGSLGSRRREPQDLRAWGGGFGARKPCEQDEDGVQGPVGLEMVARVMEEGLMVDQNGYLLSGRLEGPRQRLTGGQLPGATRVADGCLGNQEAPSSAFWVTSWRKARGRGP